jgi:hypothetical protein
MNPNNHPTALVQAAHWVPQLDIESCIRDVLKQADAQALPGDD